MAFNREKEQSKAHPFQSIDALPPIRDPLDPHLRGPELCGPYILRRCWGYYEPTQQDKWRKCIDGNVAYPIHKPAIWRRDLPPIYGNIGGWFMPTISI